MGKDGTEPPLSRYPRIDDNSLVAMADWRFDVAGVDRPEAPNGKPRFDYGPDFTKGRHRQSATCRIGWSLYGASATGRQGWQRDRRSAPPGYYGAGGHGDRVGFASEERGRSGRACYLDGSYIPFAKTKAERIAKGDNRLSLEERYRDKSDYVAQITRAAEALEKAGYILAEDRQRIIDRAEAAPW